MPDETPEPTAPSRKPSLKVVAAIAGLMAAEAAGVVALMSLTGPRAAEAGVVLDPASAAAEQPVEILLAEDKFQNMQTGRVWVWDVQVYLKVKKKNEEVVRAEIERRAAEIKAGVSQIIRRAQHAHLKEPDLRTLHRQLAAFVEEILPPDADGHSRVERIIIPKCRGFQAD